MHETSLIQFTLDAVARQARAHGIRRVSDILLIIGELRGAIPDQMEYAFRILTASESEGGMFAGTKLDIEYRPALLQCCDCGHRFPVTVETLASAACPYCGSSTYQIISGNELLIDSFRGK